MNPQILNRFSNIRLPEWDELPDLDLYMDQVISLLQRYLGQFPSPDEKGITSSMINNYVKQKFHHFELLHEVQQTDDQ